MALARAHLARLLLVSALLACVALAAFAAFEPARLATFPVALAIVHLLFLIPALWLGRMAGRLAFALVVIIAGVMGAAALLLTDHLRWLSLTGVYLVFGTVFYLLEKRFQREEGAFEARLEALARDMNLYSSEIAVARSRKQVLSERHAAFSHLSKMAEELATTLLMTELKQLVLSRVMDEILTCEEGLLYLVNESTQELELAAVQRREALQHAAEQRGNWLDAWVLRYRQPVFVEDIAKDTRFKDRYRPAEFPFRSVLVAPLLDKGRPVGCLRLSAENPYAFDADQFRLFALMGVLVSSAVTNAILFERTQYLAVHDSLTGLFVRRYFLQRLAEEGERAVLRKSSLAFLMCDVDHFKQYNDTFGHAAGDLALQHIARIITGTVPAKAVVARYGGEELGVLLPAASRAEALEVAEDIRKAVELTEFRLRKQQLPLTVSVGVAVMADDALDTEELIRVADSYLYEAKREGRNRVRSGGR